MLLLRNRHKLPDSNPIKKASLCFFFSLHALFFCVLYLIAISLLLSLFCEIKQVKLLCCLISNKASARQRSVHHSLHGTMELL